MTATVPPSVHQDTKLKRYAFWGFVLFVILTTFIPYVQGRLLAEGRQYLWMGYNFDDVCVYLSWMRQGAEGSLRTYNLFTTDPQSGMIANPLFLVLGIFAKLTTLPLIAVFHGARVLFTVTLLCSIRRLLEGHLKPTAAQWGCLLMVVFSSGVGWIPPFSSLTGTDNPIDRWQPEAITYLSLYLNPLFLISMTLQVMVLHNLFNSLGTPSRTAALKAGAWSALLALIHGYDTISLGTVWTLYLAINYQIKVNRDSLKQSLINTAIAGSITLPPALFMYLQVKTNTLFRQRVEVQTLTGSVLWILLGYGFTLCLALYATKQHNKAEQDETQATLLRFLTVWMVGNTLAAYLPLPFQRKMLQGTHLPIALLAGLGLSKLTSKATKKAQKVVLAVTILLLAMSNITFLFRECQNNSYGVVQTGQHRPYLLQGEIEALKWIEQNIPKTASIQPLPWLKQVRREEGKVSTSISDMTLACYLPSTSGHNVYCGHFGETPDYGNKLIELMNVQLSFVSDEEKKALLTKMHIKFLLFTQKQIDEDIRRIAPVFQGSLPPPPYLKKIWGNDTADIYEVLL